VAPDRVEVRITLLPTMIRHCDAMALVRAAAGAVSQNNPHRLDATGRSLKLATFHLTSESIIK